MREKKVAVAKDAVRLGQLGTPHSLKWDINTYGKFGHGHNAGEQLSDQMVYMPLAENDPRLRQLDKFARSAGCDFHELDLTDAKSGQHYMGKDKDNASINQPVIVLRYEDSSEYRQPGGEHVSFTIDVSEIHKPKLLGFVDMRDKVQSERVAHQQALDTAVSYLQNHAPDLVPAKACSGHLGDFDRGAHVVFNDEGKAQVIQNSTLNVLWIGEHEEKIWCNGKEKTLTGMKVKMHDPKTQLFHWVIVSDQNEVMVCERNISWHGAKFIRETQMPLHDRAIAVRRIAGLSTLWKNKRLQKKNHSTDSQCVATPAPQPPAPS